MYYIGYSYESKKCSLFATLLINLILKKFDKIDLCHQKSILNQT